MQIVCDHALILQAIQPWCVISQSQAGLRFVHVPNVILIGDDIIRMWGLQTIEKLVQITPITMI